MPPDMASPLGGKRPTRILIVDDHEISRAALRALLRTEGIGVADVGTGDAAITDAIAFHPDVVIVDVAPADPAGFLVARQLEALPHAPPVVLTSSSSRRWFGSQLGRHVFIAKADLCARAIEERATPGMTARGDSLSLSANQLKETTMKQIQVQAKPRPRHPTPARSAHHQPQDGADVVSRITTVRKTHVRC